MYSIVNSSLIIHDLSQDASQEIFEEIISYLDSSKNLARIITEGLSINDIGEILNNVSLKINKEMPFKGKPQTSLNEFWCYIQDFLNHPGRAVLLGLGGVHDHWSVVKSMSDNRITFFDSDGISFINRTQCSTQEPTVKRKHKIYPTHSYFLSSS